MKVINAHSYCNVFETSLTTHKNLLYHLIFANNIMFRCLSHSINGPTLSFIHRIGLGDLASSEVQMSLKDFFLCDVLL